jgi:hypothetical protein
MNNTFLSYSVANFLMYLLAGAILAVALALLLNWWVNKKLNQLVRSQQRGEKRAKLEEAINCLKSVRNEVDSLVNQLPELISKTGWVRPIRTPLWDILRADGGLPKLLEPHILQRLTLFYELLRTNTGRKQLLQSESSLAEELDSEIRRLKAELQKLQTDDSTWKRITTYLKREKPL